MDEYPLPDVLSGEPSRGAKIADVLRQLAPALVATLAGRQAGAVGAGRVLAANNDFHAQQQQQAQQAEQQTYQRGLQERAYTDRAEQLQQERRDKAAQFRATAVMKLAEIDDPVTFTQTAEQLSQIYQQQFGGDPSEFTTGLKFSDGKKMKADQVIAGKAVERANQTLGSERDAWDANPTLTLSDGRKMKYREARTLAGLAVTKDTGEELPPAPKPGPEDKTAGSFDAHFNDVLAAEEAKLGKKLSPAERAALRVSAKKSYDAANDQPRVPRDDSWKRQSALTAQQSKFSAEPIVKAYNEIATKAQTIKQILDGPQTGPGDLAIVFEFMKGLDPTSVVRETEFANAAKSGNIFKGMFAKFNGYLNEQGGSLPMEVKKEFLRLVQVKLNAQTAQYSNLRKSYAKLIDGITGEPGTGQNYLVDYGGAFPDVAGATPAAGATTPPVDAAASAEEKLKLRRLGSVRPAKAH